MAEGATDTSPFGRKAPPVIASIPPLRRPSIGLAPLSRLMAALLLLAFTVAVTEARVQTFTLQSVEETGFILQGNGRYAPHFPMRPFNGPLTVERVEGGIAVAGLLGVNLLVETNAIRFDRSQIGWDESLVLTDIPDHPLGRMPKFRAILAAPDAVYTTPLVDDGIEFRQEMIFVKGADVAFVRHWAIGPRQQRMFTRGQLFTGWTDGEEERPALATVCPAVLADWSKADAAMRRRYQQRVIDANLRGNPSEIRALCDEMAKALRVADADSDPADDPQPNPQPTQPAGDGGSGVASGPPADATRLVGQYGNRVSPFTLSAWLRGDEIVYVRLAGRSSDPVECVSLNRRSTETGGNGWTEFCALIGKEGPQSFEGPVTRNGRAFTGTIASGPDARLHIWTKRTEDGPPMAAIAPGFGPEFGALPGDARINVFAGLRERDPGSASGGGASSSEWTAVRTDGRTRFVVRFTHQGGFPTSLTLTATSDDPDGCIAMVPADRWKTWARLCELVEKRGPQRMSTSLTSRGEAVYGTLSSNDGPQFHVHAEQVGDGFAIITLRNVSSASFSEGPPRGDVSVRFGDGGIVPTPPGPEAQVTCSQFRGQLRRLTRGERLSAAITLKAAGIDPVPTRDEAACRRAATVLADAGVLGGQPAPTLEQPTMPGGAIAASVNGRNAIWVYPRRGSNEWFLGYDHATLCAGRNSVICDGLLVSGGTTQLAGPAVTDRVIYGVIRSGGETFAMRVIRRSDGRNVFDFFMGPSRMTVDGPVR